MLKNVHLKNLALIKEADIDFNSGLNIMTGETGSGKSIIIGSINIALGDKANKGMIRNGADHALVELQFISHDEKVFHALKDLDISPDGNNILISRKITPDSSAAKINGEHVTLANLRKITSLLVDVHGQHEHQSLLDPAKHLDIVDGFAGDNISDKKKEIKTEFDHYKDLRREFSSYNMDEESLNHETDLVRHELNEILKASLTEGEDEELETEYKRLSSSENIIKAVSRTLNNIDDEEKGILTKTQESLKQVDSVLEFDDSLKDIKSMLTDIDSISKDLSGALSHYIDQNQFDAARYAEVRERLDLINHLKLRYGKSIAEINLHAAELEDKLNRFSNYTQVRNDLTEQLRTSARKLNVLSSELSDMRKKAAEKLEPLIISNLKDLNFADVRFSIDFKKTEKISVNGYDKVEFLISANPGEPLAPLAKVASGGELSRIMLAIKSSAAKEDKIPTLIFDEIDTGISGFTAQKVAEKLDLLSKSHQIICITHLPQIAAMADHHYQIRKSVEDGSTISGVAALSEEQMIYEIARLVGGAEITHAALSNAKELKEEAQKRKTV